MDGRRLYQQVADRIRALVQNGQFPPGCRLPAERELSQQLGVSRPSLREALIALEIEGSVEIRMGSGIYVCSRPVPGATHLFGESPTELMRARTAIEGAVILLACVQMTPEAIDRLRGTLDDMRAAIADGQKPLAQDRSFHVILAGQSGNAVLTRIVGDLFDERHSPLSATIRARSDNAATWTAALGEHEAILVALEAADPLAAQAMMHLHLHASNERWATASDPLSTG